MVEVKLQDMTAKDMDSLIDCLGQLNRHVEGSLIMPSLHVGVLQVRSRPTDDNISMEYVETLRRAYHKLTGKELVVLADSDKTNKKGKKNVL